MLFLYGHVHVCGSIFSSLNPLPVQFVLAFVWTFALVLYFDSWIRPRTTSNKYVCLCPVTHVASPHVIVSYISIDCVSQNKQERSVRAAVHVGYLEQRVGKPFLSPRGLRSTTLCSLCYTVVNHILLISKFFLFIIDQYQRDSLDT